MTRLKPASAGATVTTVGTPVADAAASGRQAKAGRVATVVRSVKTMIRARWCKFMDRKRLTVPPVALPIVKLSQ